ncbi:MAG: acyl carrier protein, partial [Saccharothrix sp.]|nr:acyl carrier protein [Saccharothrix sp.]
PTRSELAALPDAERVPLLVERLTRGLAATLGARTPPDPDRALFDLGVDSLMAVELKNEIEGALGVSLPISAFLDGATARDLVDRIAEQLDRAADDRPDDGGIRRVERVEDVAARVLAELAAMPDDPARPAAAAAPTGERS